MLLIGAGLKNNGSLIGENDTILIREGQMSLLHRLTGSSVWLGFSEFVSLILCLAVFAHRI